MKKQPRKIKHWSEEAYGALGAAWAMLREEHGQLTEENKLELLNFGPALAALNRGIKDKKVVSDAFTFAMSHAVEDMQNREEDEPVQFSILFLLSYFDAHVSFGIIGERKMDEIMDYLTKNYDVVSEL